MSNSEGRAGRDHVLWRQPGRVRRRSAAIGGGDIDQPTPMKSLAELKSVFEKAVGPSLGVGNFTINVR